MEKEKKPAISNPGAAAQFLLEEHSGGYFRHEGDLESARRDARISLHFCIDFFENFDGTNEEKLAYLKNERDVELLKFKAKV